MKRIQARLSRWSSAVLQSLCIIGQPPRGKRSERRKKLACELLEDRTLLTADFGSLAIDPSQYDASSVIVKFRTDASGLNGNQILAGTQIDPGWSVAPGLHEVRLAGNVSVASALAAYRANPGVL